MATIPINLGPGAAPTGMLQFGQKFFITAEDTRPCYLQAGLADSQLKGYFCGIKAPTAAPTVTPNSTPATNLPVSTTIFVAYAFYSSKRVVRSQISPTFEYTIAASTNQLVISGFQNPRDDAASQDIDTILIGVQIGLNTGLMCVEPQMLIALPTFNFAAASLTFDMAGDTLAQGFDMSAGDAYFAIPPAIQYVEQWNERIWFGGVRRSVELDDSTIVVTPGIAFRPTDDQPTRAQVTISGSTWNDSYYNMGFWANGNYLGEIFDIDGSAVLYLDRDLPAAVAETYNFYLVGHHELLYPSSWHEFTPDNVATAFPECVNLADVAVLPVVLDKGETIMGLKQMQGALSCVLNESVLIGSGQDAPGSPQVGFSRLYGRSGAIAPRSFSVEPDGGVLWIGEEGLIIGDTAGAQSLAQQLECSLFFGKLTRWISPDDMPQIVANYSRQWTGAIIGNFTINGNPNYWALLSLFPQQGLFLFDGQEMTSNIIEYQNSVGQHLNLVGDSFGGRVKQLLVRNAPLTDVQPASDTPASYAWEWRGGWVYNAKRDVNSFLSCDGFNVPGDTVSFNAVRWESQLVLRNEDDFNANTISPTITFTQDDLNQDVALLLGGGIRYTSISVGGMSDSGARDGRPVEIDRIDQAFAFGAPGS